MANLKPKLEAPPRARLSLDGWAAIAAVVFILLIVVATLPRIPW
jgi:hypothetical protein